MAYRGRGRGGRFGGGRFGGGVRYAEKIEFQLFPEIADLPDVNNVKEERFLLFWSHRMQMSWKLSPYYYKGVEKDTEGSGSIDIERYSDKNTGMTKHKASLSDCIKMTDAYVPAELAVRHQRSRKRARWTQESDLQKLDIFEQLEKKSKMTDDKKEGDAEEEDDEIIEEEDEEYSDEGDYNQRCSQKRSWKINVCLTRLRDGFNTSTCEFKGYNRILLDDNGQGKSNYLGLYFRI